MKNTKDEIKYQFSGWVKNKNIQGLDEIEKDIIHNVFLNIGENKQSIFEEKNSKVVREDAIRLINKRYECGLEKFSLYMSVLTLFMVYAEFLDKYNKPIEIEVTKRDKGRDALVLAYYLSRLNYEAVNNLGYSGFSDSFKKIGELLDIKSTTIKNMRDEFDPYFDNGRAGWYQRELRASRKEVYDMYEFVQDDELTEYVKKIICEYTRAKDVSEQSGGKSHKVLKLSSSNMREIKSK